VLTKKEKTGGKTRRVLNEHDPSVFSYSILTFADNTFGKRKEKKKRGGGKKKRKEADRKNSLSFLLCVFSHPYNLTIIVGGRERKNEKEKKERRGGGGGTNVTLI